MSLLTDIQQIYETIVCNIYDKHEKDTIIMGLKSLSII